MTQRRSNRTAIAALGTIVMLAAACGGGDAAPPESGAPADTSARVAERPKPDQPAMRGYPADRTDGRAAVLGDPGNADAIAVVVNDGRIRLGRDSVGGGPTTLVIENQGDQRHVIEVFSRHYGQWRTAPIEPGGSASMSMPLTFATYEVFCTVEGHREAGEVATLRVE